MTRILFIILFICFFTLTAVAAHENVTDDNVISLDQPCENIVITSSETGNFTELAAEISNADGYLELDKDYKYISGDSVSSSGIAISKTLTINGNGHTIDASSLARIFSISTSDIILNNITFVGGRYSGSGGAIYNTGSNLLIANSTFRDCYANYGGAVYSTGTNTDIVNCDFSDNVAYYRGGVVVSTATNFDVINSTFENNHNIYSYASTSYSGGAVYSTGTYSNYQNSTFKNNYANAYAGAVYNSGGYGTLNNCTFENNRAIDCGALYMGGTQSSVNGSRFKNNTADTYDGGAIGWYGAYGKLNNSYFEANTAENHGGAVFWHANYGSLDNLEVISNNAATGAGVYIISRTYDDDNSYSNTVLNNSNFVSNRALYGGGAVDVTSHTTVENCNFDSNSAGNYGGAVGLTNSNLINSTFKNNNAIHGGAVYTYHSNIAGSTFENNRASEGNSIYVLNNSNMENNNVLDSDVYVYDNGTSGSVISSNHDIDHLMTTTNGYYAYCAERYNTNPYSGVFDDRLVMLKNSINHQPVAEYLKILIYQYLDHMDDLKNHDFHDYVWAFTDYEYWNSTDPIVREVINLYNSGFRVPTQNACKVLANGTLMYFNFSSMITPSGQQNLFLFQFDHGDVINETLTKETLNSTAFVGDDIEYRIVVSNKGTSPIYNLWVEDKDYSSGLVYEYWIAEQGNWTYENSTGHWIIDELGPGKSASIILVFRVMVNGTLYNKANSGVGNVNVTNSTNTTVAYNPNFTVEKVTLTEEVELGQQVQFEIVVTNTGDIALNELFVEESQYDGLIYDSWIENQYWTHSTVNGKHRWTLEDSLPVGESLGFIVVFNTTAYGNFTNVVVASSNETDNKTDNDTTKVKTPDFEVYKNTLTPHVELGEQVIFEIVVKNTGEVELDDIVVVEDRYDGLIFDRAVLGDEWTPTSVNGKRAWKLNRVLEMGGEEYFFVVFNTTGVGKFTNYVVATSNKTDNKTSNNTTEVNETYVEPVYHPDFTVQKITLSDEVVVGDIVEFQIIVKNTGDTVLHDVVIHEQKYDGLIYQSYVDHFGFWDFDENTMTWTLNTKFYPGEELGIHVYFKTTDVGNFTNVAVAGTSETGNKTTNSSTDVLKPEIDVRKVAINQTVVEGEQVTFEIVVHNVGQVDLEDVCVNEIDFEGLVYDHFVDRAGLWQKNDGMSWNLTKKLLVGEYEGLFVVFKTTKRGNFTNCVVVSSNKAENGTANDTVEVLEPKLDVEKIALNKTVIVGEQVTFNIVVRNVGDVALGDVCIRELEFEGLIYDSIVDDEGIWVKNDDLSWLLNQKLDVGETRNLYIVLNTTKRGNFSNYAVVDSDYVKNITSNDTVEAAIQNMSVTKNTLTRQVQIGKYAEFEIIVENTGDVDLDDVFVLESSFGSGLTYKSYRSHDMWKHDVTGDGINRFSLKDTLKAGESVSLFVVFLTTQAGNFTNTVDAGFGNSTVTNSTNSTEVVETPQKENNKTNTTNKTTIDKTNVYKTDFESKATGNPLLALILALIFVPLRRFKK